VTKVLYVEHNDDNLYMLKTRLELRGGFEVLAAEDSEKGCKSAATKRPDVILMGLEMPDASPPPDPERGQTGGIRKDQLTRQRRQAHQ
jgi:CheY-like chemotaxis protein